MSGPARWYVASRPVGPGRTTYMLIDKANRQVIRLHRQDSYTFPVNRNEQRFQLVITPQGTGW